MREMTREERDGLATVHYGIHAARDALQRKDLSKAEAVLANIDAHMAAQLRRFGIQ